MNWYASLGATVYPSYGGGFCVVFSNSVAKDQFFQDPGRVEDELSFRQQYQYASLFPNSVVKYDVYGTKSPWPYRVLELI